MRRIFTNFDFGLIAILLLLSFFGLIMIYSSSFAFAILEYDSDTHYLFRQAIWLVMGLVVFFIVSFFPYQRYGKLVPFLTILTVILLILVFIPGIGLERNFSKRWISLGGITFQPSEIAKIVMILFFAKAYTNKERYITHFGRGILPPLLVLGVVLSLVLLQPDLGTGISITLACAAILLIAGGRWLHMASLAGVFLTGLFLLATGADYRMKRIVSYLDPFADSQDDGFQLVNSYVAIGDGGLLGHGLGNSVQKLGYLPEAHTDFIMAIISEELGIFGLIIVLGLFIMLVFKGFSIYRKAPDRMGRLLAFGITAQITAQAIMNLGAVSGLLPITGIPLPLISYGGTSLFITLGSLGILMNISRQGNRKRDESERTIDYRERPQIYGGKNA